MLDERPLKTGMTHDIEVRFAFKLHLMQPFVWAVSQICVIGIGVLVGSAAMQWSGFLLLVVMLLSTVHQRNQRWKGLTIDEAIEQLRQLQKKEDTNAR